MRTTSTSSQRTYGAALEGTRAKLRELFAVDLRSLALLRIGLGISVLIDAAVRAFDLTGLYTDRGAFPRDLLLAMDGTGVYLSAHYWASTHVWLQGALFAITAVFAVVLLVGWRTWLANLVCWYLVASVQIRQPHVYMGGDAILRLLLFWGLFLPLGARFSLDASNNRVAPRSDRLTSAATVALLLQVCLIYWLTGIRKTGELWWSGEAVFYALHSNFATPFGIWLRTAPVAVLELLTYGTLALELFGPLLAFVPVHNAAFRLTTIGLFWSFHAGLGASINLGLFPLFGMVGWLAFVPTEAWAYFRMPRHVATEALPTLRSRLRSVTALICLTYVVVLLAERARIIPRVLPGPLIEIGRALRLQQTWAMFAPDPSTSIARYEMRATLADGTTVLAPAATSFRWSMYLARAADGPPNDPLAQSLRRVAQYRCLEWNTGLRDSPLVKQMALVVHVRRLHDYAPSEASTKTLVDVSCHDP
jgi:hypothetical protein